MIDLAHLIESIIHRREGRGKNETRPTRGSGVGVVSRSSLTGRQKIWNRTKLGRRVRTKVKVEASGTHQPRSESSSVFYIL